jgi:hypothetical protein
VSLTTFARSNVKQPYKGDKCTWSQVTPIVSLRWSRAASVRQSSISETAVPVDFCGHLRGRAKSEPTRIPRLIHYVWVGGELPPKQRSYIESWKATNPNFELIEWNDNNIDYRVPLVAGAYRRKQWATVSDVVRLMAVYRHGGIYLDTDFRLFRPLDPLLPHECFYSFQVPQRCADWVANGVFGAVPNHWFIGQALSVLLGIRPNLFRFERPTKYGPKLITKLLISHGLDRYCPEGVSVQGIYLCPTQFFFPFHWTESFTESCIRNDTIGAHFWEKSWERSIPAPLRILRGAYSSAKEIFSVGHRIITRAAHPRRAAAPENRSADPPAIRNRSPR